MVYKKLDPKVKEQRKLERQRTRPYNNTNTFNQPYQPKYHQNKICRIPKSLGIINTKGVTKYSEYHTQFKRQHESKRANNFTNRGNKVATNHIVGLTLYFRKKHLANQRHSIYKMKVGILVLSLSTIIASLLSFL